MYAEKYRKKGESLYYFETHFTFRKSINLVKDFYHELVTHLYNKNPQIFIHDVKRNYIHKSVSTHGENP